MPAPILVTRPIPEAGLVVLRSAGLAFDLRDAPDPPDRAELRRLVPGRTGILCQLTDPFDAGTLAAAGDLRVLATMSVGTDHIALPVARARGIVVIHTPGVLTDATAECALALLFAAARRVVEGDRMVREGRFRAWGPMVLLGVGLTGKTLGIVGAGRIGQAVARRAHGCGMRIVYHARSAKPDLERDCAARRLALDDLLRTADAVSLHCPATPETHHLLDARRLALMKPSAILVNTARGTVVHEAALVDALRAGRLRAAGLDVYEREPALAPGLAELPNVVLLPHAGSATEETRSRMAEMAAADLVAVLAGRAPVHAVPVPG